MRPTKGRSRSTIAAIVCATVLVNATAAFWCGAANSTYTVTDLGPALSTGDGGKDINNSGVAAYTRSTAVYLWQNGVGAIVNNLFAGNGPLAINDFGHLAGGDELRGFIYRNGVKTDLGTLDGGNTFAYDLNNSDVVVGSSHRDISTRGFVWQNGVMTELAGFSGPITNRDVITHAYAINDSGLIVGDYYDRVSPNQPIFWSQGQPTYLGLLPGYITGDALELNASGQIIGAMQSGSGGTNYWQAVIWNGLTPISLGSLSGRPSTVPAGINDAGFVVGAASTDGNGSNSHGFIWSNNQMVDLNTLLASGSPPWIITSASAINAAGLIVGIGTINGSVRSVLLTPIPEPHAIMGLSLLLVLTCRRRIRLIYTVRAQPL